MFFRCISAKRCYSMLPSIKINNTNKLVFTYNLDITHPKPNRHQPLLNHIQSCEAIVENEAEKIFKEKQRIALLFPIPDLPKVHNPQLNDAIKYLFYYKTILMSDNSLRFTMRSMKFANYQFTLEHLNYIVKNIIKSGRLNEVDEVLEELQSSEINNDFPMVKKSALLEDDFLISLFNKSDADNATKIMLLDNLIKVYYETSDYRYLKELIRLRERLYADRIVDNELMYIKLCWRLNSNYNCKIITKMCHDFVQKEGIKYQKMDQMVFYKVLHKIFANGEIELISSFLDIFEDHFNIKNDPLCLLMIGEFKAHYLEPHISNSSYYQNFIKFNQYFGKYNLNNEYSYYGKLLNFATHQIDVTKIYKNPKFEDLTFSDANPAVVSYFIENLLKINSKKFINQLQLIKVCKNWKNKSGIPNLNQTELLNVQYYRLLVASESNDLTYLKEELLSRRCDTSIKNIDLFLDEFNNVNLRISEKLLIVLLNNSIANIEYIDDTIDPKIIDFNKALTLHKIKQDKIIRLALSVYKLTPENLINIQKLHYKDKIITSRYIIRKWSEYRKDFKYKTQFKKENWIPPITKLLDINQLFKTPFYANNLKKEELIQSISLTYYLKFLLHNCDDVDFKDFLITKDLFKTTLPVELAHRLFHFQLFTRELQVKQDLDDSIERKIQILDKYVGNEETIVMKKKSRKRRAYRDSFDRHVNDFCIYHFLHTLVEFETLTKKLVPGKDLLKEVYFRKQMQKFLEDSVKLMLDQNYYIAASQVIKRYLSSFHYNFMTDDPQPLFSNPNQRIETILREKHTSMGNFFNIKDTGDELYDAIKRKLQKLSLHEDFQQNGGKVSLDALADYLPYRNRHHTKEDKRNNRDFFRKMQQTSPKFKLYWIMRTHEEMEQFWRICNQRMVTREEKAIEDLGIINQKLEKMLES